MAVDPFTVARGAKETLPTIQWIYRWLSKKRYPKAPRTKTGIAVAIFTDGTVHREQITHDFILTLEKSLTETILEPALCVVDVPPHLAETLKTTDQVRVLMEKTRCAFAIYGRARLRNIKRAPTYVLDLDTSVRHDLIPLELSKRLAKEMAELLPARRLISKDDDLIGFEVNAASIHFAVQYIIATVAMITGKFEYARQTFRQLQPQLRTTADMPSEIKRSIKTMKARIPPNVTASYVLEAGAAQFKWRTSRDPGLLDEIKSNIDRANSTGNVFYDAWLLGAIYWFCRHRDTRAAFAEINKCRAASIQNPTWLLSEAFLFAYTGRLDRALRSYRVAAKIGVDSRTWVEVEEFIIWIVEQEPDRVQLYFCLGLINYLGKGDEGQAQKDFNTFLRLSKDEYLEQRNVAESYLQKLRNGNS